MKKRIQGIVIGALATVLLFGGVAVATYVRTESINVTFRNIRIVIDGNECIPKDANNDTVEPFIYNGTTYLPVRAVSQALGSKVEWAGETSTVFIESKVPEEPDDGLEPGPVAQIIKNIADRDVINETLFSSVKNDQELVKMLKEYNELTSYLFGIFFKGAAETIVAVTIDGFDSSYGMDFSNEMIQSPPSFPFKPEVIAEATWRIAKHSLYTDATSRIEDDPYFTAVLEKEGGGSAGMWPQFVHGIFYQTPELGETFNEYNNLIDNITVRLH